MAKIKKTFALIIAEFFYCGRSPIMPGTMGSLGALVLWTPMIYLGSPLWLLFATMILLFIIGTWSSYYGIEHYGNDDPKQVVIDEVVGIAFPLFLAEPIWWHILAAFLLFRFFDILKPWPIKWVEKSFPAAWGIMLDDVVAGIMAMPFMMALQLIIAQY